MGPSVDTETPILVMSPQAREGIKGQRSHGRYCPVERINSTRPCHLEGGPAAVATRDGGPGSWCRKPPREWRTVSDSSHGSHRAPCCSLSSPLGSRSHKTNSLYNALQTSLPHHTQLRLLFPLLQKRRPAQFPVAVRTESPNPLIRATTQLPEYRAGGGECVKTWEETLATPLIPNSLPQHHAQYGIITVLFKDSVSPIIYSNSLTFNLFLTDPHSLHAPNYAIMPSYNFRYSEENTFSLSLSLLFS